mmetsp:Transcript_2872/g.8748  ORF Transcript_2872/g.8748 Transcript_2872/m.8748 type:complete len:402 (-) Transcript_2872:407-1612(-)
MQTDGPVHDHARDEGDEENGWDGRHEIGQHERARCVVVVGTLAEEDSLELDEERSGSNAHEHHECLNVVEQRLTLQNGLKGVAHVGKLGCGHDGEHGVHGETDPDQAGVAHLVQRRPLGEHHKLLEQRSRVRRLRSLGCLLRGRRGGGIRCRVVLVHNLHGVGVDLTLLVVLDEHIAIRALALEVIIDQLQHVIRGVSQLGALIASLGEVRHHLGDGSKVDELALPQQQQVVGQRPQGGRRLVHSHGDSNARVCKRTQMAHHAVSSGTVQASGDLIAEKDGWLLEQLNASGQAALLSARDARDEDVADLGVQCILEPQVLGHLDHEARPLLRVGYTGQLGREVERFAHSEHAHVAVLLRHIGRDAAERLIAGLAVDVDLAQDLARLDTIGDHIEHGRFPGS